MMKEKMIFSVTGGMSAEMDSYGTTRFIWKSIGAAVSGASVPAVVFYFLF